jgi:hypothetical protein
LDQKLSDECPAGDFKSMFAISRAFSFSVLPSALRAVTDCANSRLIFSNGSGVVFATAIQLAEHESMKCVEQALTPWCIAS